MTSLHLYLYLLFQFGILALSQKDIVSQEDAELHCPPCKKVHCYPRRVKSLKCKGGRTLGVCNCCPVCAKVERESCGGQWNYLGKCDVGLYCQPQESVVYSYRIDDTHKVYSLTKGTCKKGSPELSSDQAYAEFCRPKCTPEYCKKHPKAICSASDNADKLQDCQVPCQHTSCRSCRFLEPEDSCVKCTHDDFRCMQKYGKCIRRQYCSKKRFPCKADMEVGENDGKFQCQVPECLTKKQDSLSGKG